MTVRYRVRPEFRRRFAPYDGELYLELEPPDAIGYAFVAMGKRRQAIPVSNFERVEAEAASQSE